MGERWRRFSQRDSEFAGEHEAHILYLDCCLSSVCDSYLQRVLCESILNRCSTSDLLSGYANAPTLVQQILQYSERDEHKGAGVHIETLFGRQLKAARMLGALCGVLLVELHSHERRTKLPSWRN